MHILAHKKLPPDHCLSLIDRKGKEIPDPIMKLKFLSHVMEETSRLPLLYRLCPSLAMELLRTRVKGCAERVCLAKSAGAPFSTYGRLPLPRVLLHLAALLILLLPPGICLFLYPLDTALAPALSRSINSPPAHSPVFPWQSPSSGSWNGEWGPETGRDLSLYLDRHILAVFLSQIQSEFNPVLFPGEYRNPGFSESGKEEKQTGNVDKSYGMARKTSIYWSRTAKGAGAGKALHRSLWRGVIDSGERLWAPAPLLSYRSIGPGVTPEIPRWVGSPLTLFPAPFEVSEENRQLPPILPFCLKNFRKSSVMPGETTIAAFAFRSAPLPHPLPVQEDHPLSKETISSAGKVPETRDSKAAKTARKPAAEAREGGAGKEFPEYLDEPIWLVEKGAGWELYSNGLRIITTHTVDNIPRCYYRFSKNDSKLPKKEQTSNRIAGILYHSSESDLYPFLPEMNQTIKEHSRRLIRYVRSHKCYNFLIDRFGQVFRIVREDHAAFHAGNSLWADRESTYLSLNHAFVGICFEGRDFEKIENPKKEPLKISEEKTSTINSAQQRSGRELSDWLRVKFRIPQENCVPHGLASINPENRLIGYHLDLSIKFPYKTFALKNKNLTPLPSMTEFGFSYDKYFVGVFKGNLWPGIRSSEELIEKRAQKLKISPRRLRKRLNKRFDKLHRMKKDLQETLVAKARKATLRASSDARSRP